MYNKTVFIKPFPWSNVAFSGVSLNNSHITETYDFIVTALLYKIKYEKLKILKKEKDYEDFNLSNPAVFLKFRDDVCEKIPNNTTVNYIMDCVIAIKNSDFSKKNIRDSFELLKQHLTDTKTQKALKNAFTLTKEFLNFKDIFEYANKELIDENSKIITKINDVVAVYSEDKIK